MADYKHGFYWVKIEGETELTIAEYDGLWWFIGNDGGEKLHKNTTVLEMIERKGNPANLENANCAIFDVSGSLPSDEELQKVVERIAYEQHGEDQAEDCYAKMGILHEFVKTYVNYPFAKDKWASGFVECA